MFLERRKTMVYTQGDGVAFVDELHRRWIEQNGQKPSQELVQQPHVTEVPEFKTDCVFLSYASEDYPIAKQVRDAFDSAEIDV